MRIIVDLMSAMGIREGKEISNDVLCHAISFLVFLSSYFTRDPIYGSENLAPVIWWRILLVDQGRAIFLPCACGQMFCRLEVCSTVELVVVVQVVRGGEMALCAARTVDQKKERERNTKHNPNEYPTSCSEVNEAADPDTERNESQAKNHSEMFHIICLLSSQKRKHADLFLSLIIDAGRTEILHDPERFTPFPNAYRFVSF
jgi:hypothetical protein